MRVKVRLMIQKLFLEHPAAYIFAFFAFAAGCVSGAYYYKFIGSAKVPYFASCLDGYIRYIADGNADRWGIFLNSFYKNMQTFAIIMICGMHPALFFLSPIVISGRGFVLGFTISVLICVMGWQGVPVLLFGIIPQYIILIPLLLYSWVLCYSRISERMKGARRARRFMPDSNDKQYFAKFFFIALVAVVIAGYLALIMPSIMNGLYGFLKSYI